jgi:AcrR family transcriptional regulator
MRGRRNAPDSVSFQRAARASGQPGLDVDQIVKAAVTIADDEGLQAVTMRRVARELGRSAVMSLYRHVLNRDDVVELMIDAVIGEALAELGPADTMRSFLREEALTRRRVLLRHPWAVEASAGRAALGPNSLAYVERMLSAVEEFGVEADLAQSMVNAVDAYTTGFVSDQVARARAVERSGMAPEDILATIGPYMREAVESGKYPALARFMADHRHPTPDESFEFGLDRLLDGFEAYLGRT